MLLLTALGNPGTKYQKTRHNVGWLFIDFLLDKLKITPDWREKFHSEYCNIELTSDSLIPKFLTSLLPNREVKELKNKGIKEFIQKPLTFMNESGLAVQELMNFYKIKPTDLVVIHDDLDLEIGRYKIQTDRSSAGHRGVQSIIDRLGTQDFTRLRIGIADKELEKNIPPEDFVLGKLNENEKKTLEGVFEEIIK